MSTLASLKGPSWVHESPFLTEGWENRSKAGSPSLKHSAMRKTLSDQRNLTPQLFANVPWRIASYLWDCLGKSRKQTVYMWKLFATAYPIDFRGINQYRSMKIEGPKMSMRDYLGLVKSDSLSWGVALTLANLFARVPELVDIASIKNLVALEIITLSQIATIPEETDAAGATLSDRIVRTWSELAQTSAAFSHLRVLRLYNQEDLSKVALRYMDAFPSLRLIIAHDCPHFTSLVKHGPIELDGWEVSTISQPKKSNEDPSEPDTLYECYKTSLMDIETQDQPTLRDTPILDFQVGQINPTRRKKQSTVYLERKKNADSTQEPATKKQKLASTAAKKPKTKGPVMKDRKAKDLRCLLQDFL
ncbi:hypothetical protein AWENTII_008577 [Aspergillus wentii]